MFVYFNLQTFEDIRKFLFILVLRREFFFLVEVTIKKDYIFLCFFLKYFVYVYFCRIYCVQLFIVIIDFLFLRIKLSEVVDLLFNNKWYLSF